MFNKADENRCSVDFDFLFVIIIVFTSSGEDFVFLFLLAISFIWLRTLAQLGKNCKGVKTMQHKRSPISIDQSSLSSLTEKRHKASTSLSSKVSFSVFLSLTFACLLSLTFACLRISCIKESLQKNLNVTWQEKGIWKLLCKSCQYEDWTLKLASTIKMNLMQKK